MNGGGRRQFQLATVSTVTFHPNWKKVITARALNFVQAPYRETGAQNMVFRLGSKTGAPQPSIDLAFSHWAWREVPAFLWRKTRRKRGRVSQ